MSSSGTPVFQSNYEHNPGVVKVWISSYPNNPGVMAVWTSNYEHNPGVMKIYMTSYEHNPGVRKIYMSGCFPADELVHTSSDTYVPIGSLRVGNKIASWNKELEKLQYTVVTDIHKYTVNDIFCFNNSLRVSSTHPLLVVETKHDVLMPKWKVAFDIKIGEHIVGADGKLIAIKTKSRHWHSTGTEVLNLSTDNGVPFLAGNCVVRAENAQNHEDWASAPLTQKLFVAKERSGLLKVA